MKLSKKYLIIIALTILVGIVALFVTQMIIFNWRNQVVGIDNGSGLDELDEYAKRYEARRQNISAHIKNINERYGQAFKEQLQKEADDALQSGKLEEPDMLNDLLEQIEEYESNNVFWDKGLKNINESWSRCRVTRGFTLDLAKPTTLPSMQNLEDEQLYVIVECGVLGLEAPNADIYNQIVYNNARRYLYKVFEGRIEEEQVEAVISELLAPRNTDYETIKNYNGIDYKFEYWKDPQEIRITFKWD